MRPLEGRVLSGLDEFMLRLGHLTVLCKAAAEASGSIHRLTKAAVERLTLLVPVEDANNDGVAKYLRAKKLCPERDERASPSFDSGKFRYPDLVLVKRGGQETIQSWPDDGTPAKVSWQDFCLAADDVRSRVGSVTVHGKFGSKTGLSHIVDWATMLELIGPSGALFANGQLLAKYVSVERGSSGNPYVLGNERLIYADLIIRRDFDAFAQLVSSLASNKAPLRKKEATQEYVDAIQVIADRAEKATQLSQRQRQNLFALWRDLRRSGRDEIITTTAWHRAASRFENYVDLGLLQKGLGGEKETYEYKYYPTDALSEANETLMATRDAESWLNDHLADVILGQTCSRTALSPEELLQVMPTLTGPLARPTSPLPIDTLALGLLWLKADMGHPITLGTARRSIEELATKRPDLARLSTGSTTRAEYISIKQGDKRHGGDARSPSL